MSGLEALGVAANIVGVIGFGIQVASLCKAIYNGRSTNEEVLSDCTKSMGHASAEIIRQSDGWQPQGLVERELVNMAEECHRIAKELESEVQYITGSYKKNSASSALKGTLRGLRRRGRLEELEKSLQSYKNTMETQILVHITSKIDQAEASQLQNMDNISKELQLLLSQAAAGRAQVDNANDSIIKALGQSHSAIATRIDTSRQQNQQDAITQAARQHFLQSFKFPEMNQRFNNILHPEDATLTQVFARYRDLGSQVTKLCIHSDKQNYVPADAVWFEFISWLKSENRFFWIQGKPGSGKSTLVRYLISNNTTRKLLDQWRSEPIILSHFVWKIGTPLQRSLQGLYCTLVHQLLSKIRDQTILDDLIVRFKEEASKDTVHDWPVTQLKALLFSILEDFPPSVALFIDGLDEMCAKEQDGLIDFIDRIEHLPRVKLCVASRAEWQFRQRFCQVPTLKLHELMAADMEKFLQEKFHSFETNGFITKPMSSKIISLLLQKAQGVFLWLQLVTNSIKNGLLHKNCEQDLLLRLDQLPSDLEDLYIDMWKRSTDDEPIYRAQAAYYFNLVSHMDRICGYRPCVLLVALARQSNVHSTFLDVSAELPSSEQLGRICEVTSSEIATRCFGLIEIQFNIYLEYADPNKANSLKNQHGPIHSGVYFSPRFIHRTASDFLDTTELGQRILSFDSTPLFEIEDSLLKAYMCTSRVVNRAYGLRDAIPFSWQDGHDWLRMLSCSKNPSELLHLTESFYHSGILVLCENRPPWYPNPLFLSAVARFPAFIDFVVTSTRMQQEPDLASAILRDIWAWDEEYGFVTDELQRLITGLRQAGANVLSNGMSFVRVQQYRPRLVPYGNPLSLFLGVAVDVLSHSLRAEYHQKAEHLSTAALIQRLTTRMLKASSSPVDSSYRTFHVTGWSQRLILHGVRAIRNLFCPQTTLRPNFDTRYTAILDTNLAFLSSYVLNLATCMQEINNPNIASAWGNASKTPPVLLCVLDASDFFDIKCYVPLEQTLVSSLIEWLLPGMHGMSEEIHNESSGTMNSLQNHSLYKEVDYITFITALAKERVAFVSLNDIGARSSNSSFM